MQRSNIFFLVIMFLLVLPLAAQEQTYIINKDTLQLKKEVNGPLSLLWQDKDNSYRFFVQKKNRIVELKNTSGQEEYKQQLRELTQDEKLPTEEVRFELYSLKNFTNSYNFLAKQEYAVDEPGLNFKQRAGLFTGLSNNIYASNPENALAPVVGLEYEIYEPDIAPRHSAFAQLRQSFKQDNFRYSSTQFSVNYRFTAWYFSDFSLHVNARLLSFGYSDETIKYTNDAGKPAIKREKGLFLDAPFSFGVGSDIEVTPNSFITVGYNDIFALFLDSNGKFPIDFTIGYKYKL